MPELPEVEVVRSGLATALAGKSFASVTVLHPRPVRYDPLGPEHFARLLSGRVLDAPRRRGKYLWIPFEDGDALLCHLGMSGQFRINRPEDSLLPNTRVLFDLQPHGDQLRFVDQRMFGGLQLAVGGAELPGVIGHIAMDPFDDDFDPWAVGRGLVSRRSTVKRALLNQTLVSGIGNIYADETLWRSRLHGDTPCQALGGRKAAGVLRTSQQVMAEALEQGGTSFDALYVNVNGSSGYFARHLDVYGREDLPCRRCGRSIVRDRFMNRSSFRCPRCQRLPRQVAPPSGQDATLGCKPS